MPDLTFYRDVSVADLDAGDTFVDGTDTFYVDEVRHRLTELELLGYPSSRSTGKRIGKTYARDDELPMVRLTPDPVTEVALVNGLAAFAELVDICSIDNAGVVGWSAQLADSPWRVMVLTVKPEGVTSIVGRIIDVTATDTGIEVTGVLDDPVSLAWETQNQGGGKALRHPGPPDPNEEALATAVSAGSEARRGVVAAKH